ncbi:hypothetical protein JX265_009769 [Neoarthrinium moseri]|uniref:BRCT domain-containing protein n=1 Tax=Neoarthrinium moseri TaxID=1658444 RepID=A0A9P9WG02_9PEZI|nr:hypothetical protein JX265_009769 [Neoarthrinium moseri]
MAPKSLDGKPKAIFKNIVVALAGKMSGDFTDEKLTEWMKLRGGSFSAEFDNSVTHLVASKEQFKKKVPRVKEALNRKKVEIVDPNWLEMSMVDNKRRDLKHYSFRAKHNRLKAKQAKANKAARGIEQDARNYVNTHLYHVYSDETVFRYQIELVKNDGARMYLELWESNNKPHLYFFALRYIRCKGAPMIYQRQSETPGPFDREFDMFRKAFCDKVGILWNDRMDEADGTGLVKPVKGKMYSYQIPTLGKPVGHVRGKVWERPEENQDQPNISGSTSSFGDGESSSSSAASTGNSGKSSSTNVAAAGESSGNPYASIFGNGEASSSGKGTKVSKAKLTIRNSTADAGVATKDKGKNVVRNGEGFNSHAAHKDGRGTSASSAIAIDDDDEQTGFGSFTVFDALQDYNKGMINEAGQPITGQDTAMTDAAPSGAPAEQKSPALPMKPLPITPEKLIVPCEPNAPRKAGPPVAPGESSNATKAPSESQPKILNGTAPAPWMNDAQIEALGVLNARREREKALKAANARAKALNKKKLPTVASINAQAKVDTEKKSEAAKESKGQKSGSAPIAINSQPEKTAITAYSAKHQKNITRPAPAADPQQTPNAAAGNAATNEQELLANEQKLLSVKRKQPEPSVRRDLDDLQSAAGVGAIATAGATAADDDTTTAPCPAKRAKTAGSAEKAKPKQKKKNQDGASAYDIGGGDDADVEDLSDGDFDPDEDEDGPPPEEPAADKVAGLQDLMALDAREADAQGAQDSATGEAAADAETDDTDSSDDSGYESRAVPSGGCGIQPAGAGGQPGEDKTVVEPQ